MAREGPGRTFGGGGVDEEVELAPLGIIGRNVEGDLSVLLECVSETNLLRGMQSCTC